MHLAPSLLSLMDSTHFDRAWACVSAFNPITAILTVVTATVGEELMGKMVKEETTELRSRPLLAPLPQSYIISISTH